MNTKPKILYFETLPTSFTKRDHQILNELGNLTIFNFGINKSLKTILPAFINQLTFLIRESRSTDYIFIKFLGYHSLLPLIFSKLFRIQTYCINGGTDCHYFPDYKYGNFYKAPYSIFTKLSYKLANNIITLHHTLVYTPYTYDPAGYPSQGFKSFVKNLKPNIIEINNGYDFEVFKDYGFVRKPFTFVTAATDYFGSNFFIKGLDLYIELANHFNNYNWTIIGDIGKESFIPENITIIPKLNQNELINILNKNTFYVQLSSCEGFPNTLSEAMLCGCIPIGTNVFAIPDIINGSGFILDTKDINKAINLINDAVLCDRDILRIKSREQIINNFSIQKRKEAFNKLFPNK